MNRPMRVSTLLAGALLLTACSVSTEPDQKALVYDAGAFSDTTYQECVSAPTPSTASLTRTTSRTRSPTRTGNP
jgi:PBP1b-binding outer membrane lipoprotein LpoB